MGKVSPYLPSMQVFSTQFNPYVKLHLKAQTVKNFGLVAKAKAEA